MWEPGGRSDSSSLGDLGADSEEKQRMIWALKDAPGVEDRAYFVQGGVSHLGA